MQILNQNNKKPGKTLKPSQLFIYLTLVQHTKHPVFNPLNYLFNMIKLLAQLLHLIVVSDDSQVSFRNLHRHAAPGLKSRLLQPVALKVQAGVA